MTRRVTQVRRGSALVRRPIREATAQSACLRERVEQSPKIKLRRQSANLPAACAHFSLCGNLPLAWPRRVGLGQRRDKQHERKRGFPYHFILPTLFDRIPHSR
ncbi:hypothetical protein MTO96_009092 [Rhipicephalus appendiculatus]